MANTATRNYPKPVSGNDISDDVLLLQSALDLVDGDVDALLTALSGKASTSHGHEIEGVAGLQSALDNKSATNHAHSLDNLTGVSGASGAATGMLLQKGVGDWNPVSVAAAVGDVVEGLVDAGLASKLDKAGDAMTGPLDVTGPTSAQIVLRTAATEQYKIGRNASDGILDFQGSQPGYTGYRFKSDDGSTLMEIDDDGYVLQPQIPCFTAYGTGPTLAASTEGVIPFNATLTNNGNHFNTVTHRFTAPVAGNYFFSAIAQFRWSTSGQMFIRKNGGSQSWFWRNVVDNDDGSPVSGSLLLTLAAGDYVDVYYSTNTNSDLYMGQITKFSGFLIG